jgi:hypothetical protein
MTRRSGPVARKWRALSAVSDSIVTRVYSSAGQTRTATIAAPQAISRVPSSRTVAPMRRKALRRALMGAAIVRVR